MECKSWELLDVDEYFIKYIRISPILTYSEDDYNIKKLNLQSNLLNRFMNKEISKEDIQKLYSSVINMQSKISINLSELSYELKKIYKETEDKLNIEKEKRLDEIASLADV
jgi:hypothetical protein